MVVKICMIYNYTLQKENNPLKAAEFRLKGGIDEEFVFFVEGCFQHQVAFL